MKMRPENIIDQDEERIVLGALSYSDKIAYDIMIPENRVFCLELNQRFSSELLSRIKSYGFSRIPVYRESRCYVVGILHVLQLLSGTSILGKKVKEFYENRGLATAQGTQKLDELLNNMVYLKRQMALIKDKKTGSKVLSPLKILWKKY